MNPTKDIKERISVRKKVLDKASINLKKHFVGIDHIIDGVMKNIEAWYVLPEILTRPVILNLWGLTGVGKTDLVRRLVKELSFQDRFLELQLVNKGGSTTTKLEEEIDYSSIEPGKPGILLLDEIQRFRSISNKDDEIFDYKYQDVWTLLSDGRFSTDASMKRKITEMIIETLYWEEQRKKEEDDEEGLSRKQRRDQHYKMVYWEATALKKLLKLEDDLEEIMTWDFEKKVGCLKKHHDRADTYEGIDYSKLLIFISGNLDEAFSMANNVNDIDLDADVFHNHSKRVNLIEIKEALKKRFKPEQIARFGNVHFIYPSLSKSSYREIMIRQITRILKEAKLKTTLDFKVDDSVYDFIYRNGVFPAQGTRPLFSTISSSIENSIPHFILGMVDKDMSNATLAYRDNILYLLENEEISVSCVGEIDKIRAKNPIEKKIAVSVHEAGHAVSYSVLFGLVPTQITADTVSDIYEGFSGVHKCFTEKQMELDRVCTLLSGRAAEEIVFGEDRISRGCIGDLHKATSLVSSMVRMAGMGSKMARVIPQGSIHHEITEANADAARSDVEIEEIVQEQADRARETLIDNLEFFNRIVEELIERTSLLPEEFKQIADEYGIETKVLSAEKVHYPSEFKEMYDAHRERS